MGEYPTSGAIFDINGKLTNWSDMIGFAKNQTTGEFYIPIEELERVFLGRSHKKELYNDKGYTCVVPVKDLLIGIHGNSNVAENPKFKYLIDFLNTHNIKY